MANFALILTTLFIGFTAQANEHAFGERSIFSDRAVKERLHPVGQVCVQGEECLAASGNSGSSADSDMQVAKSKPLTAESIYQSKCLACHASGAAGAPKTGVASDWTARLEQGMDTLVQNAIVGLNAMPPKGLCMECGDDDIRATVEYMLDQN